MIIEQHWTNASSNNGLPEEGILSQNHGSQKTDQWWVIRLKREDRGGQLKGRVVEANEVEVWSNLWS